MKWNLKFRKWHRDFSYFYAGLLMAFSISGLALNHRQSWDPRDYTYETIELKIDLPTDEDAIDDTFFENWLKQNDINLEFRGSGWRRGGYNLYFEDAYAYIDPQTGKGELEMFHIRPVLGQMVDLHKSNDSLWLWYSDIFAISVLIICLTGLIITKGKYGFKQRGWKLALVGVVIPSIIWFFI